MALAWAAGQEGVSSVILGASRIEQLQENLQALAMTVDEQVGGRLDELFPSGGPAGRA